MSDPVSVVVPAKNEAGTIRKVVETLSAMPAFDEVVVVDNGSDDGTPRVAEEAGARVIFEEQPGMGHAVRAGFSVARNDWVMKVDADLDKFDINMFAHLPEARAPGVGLIKGVWHDPNDNMPMTRLLVMPAIQQMFPGLADLTAPNSGIYLVNRSLIAHGELVGSYAADLDVMLRVHAAGAQVSETDIGRIENDPRDLKHYNAMAETIMGFFLKTHEKQITEELVVLAQDAGQVIQNCLGVLARRSRSGGPVTVYLSDYDTVEATVLRHALSPFPTARILPLADVSMFHPVGPLGRMRLITPYPAASEDRAIRSALQIQSRFLDDQRDAPELLLMPLGTDRSAVEHFRADTALDVGNGHEIKRAALVSISGAGDVTGPREVFQTYASLPDALKLTVGPVPGSEAGNM